MKLANLPNGQQIPFDDSIPDDHMDGVVQKVMGAGNHDQKMDLMGSMVMQLAKQADTTHHGNVAIVQALNGIANSLGMLAQMIAPLQASMEMNRMATEASTSLIGDKLDGLAEIYGAERELVLDKGKPVGLKIKAH